VPDPSICRETEALYLATNPAPNEALNLRAADAAAVADAADNPASKRRHRGPQLSAGALGLHPLDA